MPEGRSKSFYDTLANKAKQYVQNCFPNANITSVGSRAGYDFRRESDYDFRIEIGGANTTKDSFYPRLIECLQGKLSTHNGERIITDYGTNRNVVNVKPERGGKISFALV